jgi:hypothetical protein
LSLFCITFQPVSRECWEPMRLVEPHMGHQPA